MSKSVYAEAVKSINIGAIIKWSLLAWVGILLFFYIKKKNSPYNQAVEVNAVKSLEVSKRTMENGRTYYAVADEIFSHLHAKVLWSWNFTFKNTDEKALGALMLTVKEDEYDNLSDVYLHLKKAMGTNQSPLSEDLFKTFNSKERRMYLSHLMTL